MIIDLKRDDIVIVECDDQKHGCYQLQIERVYTNTIFGYRYPQGGAPIFKKKAQILDKVQ